MHDKKFVPLMFADSSGLTIADKAEFIRMIVYPAIHEAIPVPNHPANAKHDVAIVNLYSPLTKNGV